MQSNQPEGRRGHIHKSKPNQRQEAGPKEAEVARGDPRCLAASLSFQWKARSQHAVIYQASKETICNRSNAPSRKKLYSNEI